MAAAKLATLLVRAGLLSFFLVIVSVTDRDAAAKAVWAAVTGAGPPAVGTPARGSARPSPEAQLRAAIASRRKTVLRLTADVRLTRDIGNLTCPDLTIIGSCRTRNGRPRRCTIDGRKKFGGFTIQNLNPGDGEVISAHLTLSDLEIKGMGKTLLEVMSAGWAEITNCVVRENDPNSYALIDVYSGSVGLKRSSFIANSGTVLALRYASGGGSDVVFESNRNGEVVGLDRATFDCVRCKFENNSAAGGGVAVNINRGYTTFTRTQFIGNSVTRVGGVGAAVEVDLDGSADFCYCQFDRNTVRLPRGKSRIANVYIKLGVDFGSRANFCPKRPSSGVILEDSTLAQNVQDNACTNCN